MGVGEGWNHSAGVADGAIERGSAHLTPGATQGLNLSNGFPVSLLVLTRCVPTTDDLPSEQKEGERLAEWLTAVGCRRGKQR